MLVQRGVAVLLFCGGLNEAAAVEEYTVADEFNGCDYGQLYPLEGGRILECKYEYFYAYRPRVIADGRQVIMIDDEKIDGYIHDGSVFETNVNGTFEGCEFNKVYSLVNGLLFQCHEYKYKYAYRPDVKIYVIEGRGTTIFIDKEKFEGELFKKD